MEKFIENLKSSYTVEKYKDGFVLYTPIMYKYADHTFSFYIKQNENGGFTITDRGQTLDYLDEAFDPMEYWDSILKVCKKFEIDFNDGVFSGKIASYQTNQTMRTLNIFIGAINIIANIDVFD